MKEMRNLLCIILFIAINGIANGHEDRPVLINSDYIWEYVKYNTYSGADDKGPYICKTAYTNCYTFGDTVIKYGKSYTEWKLIEFQERNEIIYEQSPEDAHLAEPIKHVCNSVVAYMREESGRILILIDDLVTKYYDSDSNKNIEYVPTRGEEAVLYDFSSAIGDSYLSIYSGCVLTEMSTVKISDTECNGNKVKEVKVLTSSGMKKLGLADYECQVWNEILTEGDINNFCIDYVEGIGNISFGGMTFLTEPFMKLIYNGEKLNKVYDREGNMIYSPFEENKGSDIHDLFIGSIPQSERIESDIIFDLHGRIVTNPQPGSVYIRGGKKFVAR